MLASFLLALREGIEAALVIGIVLGVLQKLKRTDLNRTVWSGLALAVIASAAGAVALTAFGMEFEGPGEMIFEGLAMFFAAVVLTWMVVWMHGSAPNLKQQIETRTRHALGQQTGRGLFVLAFLAVFREGIELALFLVAVEKASNPVQTLLGAVVGLAAAAFLGWTMVFSSRKLNLASFFRVTNILLVLFAAGMVAGAAREFVEVGFLPALVDPIWNVNPVLSDKGQIGLLLKALIGYNGNPSLMEVIIYITYLLGIGVFVFANRQKRAGEPVRASA